MPGDSFIPNSQSDHLFSPLRHLDQNWQLAFNALCHGDQALAIQGLAVMESLDYALAGQLAQHSTRWMENLARGDFLLCDYQVQAGRAHLHLTAQLSTSDLGLIRLDVSDPQFLVFRYMALRQLREVQGGCAFCGKRLGRLERLLKRRRHSACTQFTL